MQIYGNIQPGSETPSHQKSDPSRAIADRWSLMITDSPAAYQLMPIFRCRRGSVCPPGWEWVGSLPWFMVHGAIRNGIPRTIIIARRWLPVCGPISWHLRCDKDVRSRSDANEVTCILSKRQRSLYRCEGRPAGRRYWDARRMSRVPWPRANCSSAISIWSSSIMTGWAFCRAKNIIRRVASSSIPTNNSLELGTCV